MTMIMMMVGHRRHRQRYALEGQSICGRNSEPGGKGALSSARREFNNGGVEVAPLKQIQIARGVKSQCLRIRPPGGKDAFRSIWCEFIDVAAEEIRLKQFS